MPACNQRASVPDDVCVIDNLSMKVDYRQNPTAQSHQHPGNQHVNIFYFWDAVIKTKLEGKIKLNLGRGKLSARGTRCDQVREKEVGISHGFDMLSLIILPIPPVVPLSIAGISRSVNTIAQARAQDNHLSKVYVHFTCEIQSSWLLSGDRETYQSEVRQG